MTTTIDTRRNHALEGDRMRLLAEAAAIDHSARELALAADLLSERAHASHHAGTDSRPIEEPLGRLRRSCADAQLLADTVRTHLESTDAFSSQMADACDETLHDAAVRLTVADAAYDDACAIAS